MPSTSSSSSDKSDEEDGTTYEYFLRPTPREIIQPDAGSTEDQPADTDSSDVSSELAPYVNGNGGSMDNDNEEMADPANVVNAASDAEDDDTAPQDNDPASQDQELVTNGDEPDDLSTNRPTRERHPPNPFTYHQLGNPDPYCMPVFSHPGQCPDPLNMMAPPYQPHATPYPSTYGYDGRFWQYLPYWPHPQPVTVGNASATPVPMPM